MKVCEIFSSIQGESSFAGLPCTFIRLTGCNLRCSFCDTAYAYEEGEEYTEEELLAEARQRGIRLVCVTGGEPLLQKGARQLVRRLSDGGFTVLIETNGSIGIKGIDPRARIILDMKAPGSGMSKKMDLGNIDLLRHKDEVKFVLLDRADYEWARDFMAKRGLAGKCRVLLSPAFGRLRPDDLARWMLEDGLEARLNLQLHKYIFGQKNRGV